MQETPVKLWLSLTWSSHGYGDTILLFEFSNISDYDRGIISVCVGFVQQ